jgi:hypothetical protein
MAAFAKRYLRFGKKNPRHDEIHVLWPVYVYRVMYPVPKDKLLNLFQEAILGLCRAQCTDRQEISRLLGIDHELVAYIMLQMMRDRWLDERGKITRLGIEMLDEDRSRKGELSVSRSEASQQELKMGYAFWDAISQKWLPRFMSTLPEIEPHEERNGFPSFIINRESGKIITPHQLHGDILSLKNINDKFKQQLFEVHRTYQLDIHHARQLKLGEDLPREQEVHMGSIEFISDQPDPMYLWVSILRKPLLEVINREKGLITKLSKLIGEPQPEKQTAEEWLTLLDERIRMEMLLEYPYLENHLDIVRYMTALKRRQAKVQDGIANDEEIDSLLSDAQKLIESVLKWMLKRWIIDIRRLPDYNKPPSKQQLMRIYHAIELDALSDNVIESLSRQHYGAIHDVLRKRENSTSSMKALLCGVSLTTSENSDHPFKRLDENVLSLPLLLELADMRNKAGHASGHRFDKQEVLNACDFSIQWTTNFKEWF